jgi:HSP20 family protein
MVDIDLKKDRGEPRWLSPDENEQGSGHFHYRVGSRSHKWRPATDVYETEKAFIVRVEIAGMRDQEFTIMLEERTVTIQGNRPDQDKRRAFHQMEIRYGEFSTSVNLHWPIDPQAVEAEYSDGILRVVLPKAVPHSIQIGK